MRVHRCQAVALLIVLAALVPLFYAVWQNGKLRGELDSYRNLALVADADRAEIQKRFDRCRGVR